MVMSPDLTVSNDQRKGIFMLSVNSSETPVGAIIMAAGRGSRMKGYAGNKTLLPLAPGASLFEGRHPLLLQLMQNLPAGPKVVVVNHCKDDVIQATRGLGVSYCEQPRLNGTGGAILAAQAFIESQTCRRFIITMGDVPFVKPETYTRLVQSLDGNDIVILGFCPSDKKQYGVLEIEAQKVQKITEWKYWKTYTAEVQQNLTICNSGIYAVTREALCAYLPVLASRPQIVHKEINGQMTAIEEFFITDLIEFMVKDGKNVGYHVAADEIETMGVDDADALEKAQALYAAGKNE
jgi:bifunctional UDP-N-acetylglucosamine pyrophosphorylase / glucosamine-1-phosphate N-acetyltransferase